MFARLGCLFVVAPLVELALLVQVGRWMGVFPTVAVVALTGLVGAWLARGQGVRTLAELQSRAARGEMPGDALLDGASILVGGLLLLTPGLLSDALGFALLVPFTRRALQRWAMRRVVRSAEEGRIHVSFVGMGPFQPGRGEPPPGPDPGSFGEHGGPRGGLDDPGGGPEDPPPRPGEIIQR
jgi:UPF0716 protein FxsA